MDGDVVNGPLRSLLIGDVSHYPSEFIFGVGQGMTLLGHFHSTVDIRTGPATIWQRVEQVQPNVIWGHMLLWSPLGDTDTLLNICEQAKRRWDTRVIIHDGDARAQTRYPVDVRYAVDLALCNHTASRAEWGVKQLRWPYGAFVQSGIAKYSKDFGCELVFAGRLGDSAMYHDRTQTLLALHERLGARFRMFPTDDIKHTLMRTPEIAASADAVLGWGRPESPGWTDVRVFQYPGAGGILLHDDASEWLDPWREYVPIATRGNVGAIMAALDFARGNFGHLARSGILARIQRDHSMLVRVRQALAEADL